MNKELWNEFLEGKAAVNCRTENQAEKFLKYCEGQKMKWSCGDEPSRMTFWKYYKEKICYVNGFENYRNIATNSIESFESKGLKIITFKQLAKTDEQPAKDKQYKGWEILKMIEEEELKVGDKLVSNTCLAKYEVKEILKHPYLWNETNKDWANVSLTNDTFTIKGKEEYLTFDEARKSGKKFKYKDWEEFYSLSKAISFLSIYSTLEIEEMLDEKAWEVEQ